MSSRSASTMSRCSRVAGMPSGRCQYSYRTHEDTNCQSFPLRFIRSVCLLLCKRRPEVDILWNEAETENQFWSSHLSEDKLKVTGLSCPQASSPILASHEGDVIALEKKKSTARWGRAFFNRWFFFTWAGIWNTTYNDLNIYILYWSTPRPRHIWDGILELSSVGLNLWKRLQKSIMGRTTGMTWELHKTEARIGHSHQLSSVGSVTSHRSGIIFNRANLASLMIISGWKSSSEKRSYPTRYIHIQSFK